MLRRALLPLLVLGSLPACRGRLSAEDPPATRAVEHVDEYHGRRVEDPYRWLEEMDSDETKAWIAAQNERTREFLERGSARKRIRRRLEQLWNFERFSVPVREGGRYFFRRNDGLQDQAVLYVADGLAAEPRVLLDPNTLSPDGTVSLRDRFTVSPDGRLLAYGLSRGGSDWQEIRVRDVETGEDLGDTLQWIKFSDAAWVADGSGFYYARMPEPEAGKELSAANRRSMVCFHRLGTPQSEDAVVYERKDQPDWFLYPWVTDDRRYLGIYASAGSASTNALLWKDLASDGPVVELPGAFEASYDPVGNDGPTWWILTDRGAPKRRLVAVDLANPQPEAWRELVPEGRQPIEQVTVVGDRFLVRRLKVATTRVSVFTLDGALERELDLPGLGTADGFEGRRKDRETFYSFSAFTAPTTIYRHDFDTGRSEVWRRPRVDFDPGEFETKQVVYPSHDGTHVPMFLSHRKGLELDGRNPTLLHGYGGFRNSLTPWFRVSTLVWMELGGVYAVANLRGGGEFGEEWHKAGMLEKKQNVFDDFVAAGEALVRNGYTTPRKLAIAGTSNGGLLVAACMNQRPDLFGACLPSVGVMDMLRYQEFTVGRAWVSEYGSSAEPAMFPVLLGYSPYHNLRKGVRYPATLVMTGDHDDRVVPAHSYKYAARLQACQAGEAPILLRVETSTGHGAGTPTSKWIDDAADQWAFLARVLEIDVPRRIR
jgi:prolyl oligopeptidase